MKNSDTGEEPLLLLQGVTKSFGETEILHGIDLTLRRAELAALIGPSGSGKSTLLNLLGLLDRPTSGTLRLLSREVARLDDAALTALRSEALGFIFQFHHLIPALSVLENVMMPAAARAGGFSDAHRPRAMELLSAMGLAERAASRPRELSGGMQQRVAVARALMNDPPLILADEPTGNLDTETSDRVFELLERQNRGAGTAFLIVTHDDDLARRCDRVLRIVDGRMVADGPTESVLPAALEKV